MIPYYFAQAWRRIAKDKTYSFLNIVGLSAGLTCFAFIALWVKDELSYDAFNQNVNRIVRLTQTIKTENGLSQSAATGAPMAQALQQDYAEIENTVRMDSREELVQHQNQQTLESILLTEPSFFKIFSYHLTQGHAATALQEPYSVILTESTARKYFGNANPVGQTLTIYMYDKDGKGTSYKVTGITPDPPPNAHFSFTVLASFSTIAAANPAGWNDWSNSSLYTYLLLQPGVSNKAFSAKISRFYAKYTSEQLAPGRAISAFALQPLRDIHLSGHLQNELAPSGDKNQVYTFATIGVFILLLAGINYTNLATARATGRAKEVGIKKVVGAHKKQLIFQYLSESVVMALLALLLALFLSFFIEPFFYQLTGKNRSLFASPYLLLFLTGVTLFLGLLSGIYPALVLSAFKPASILKGAFRASAQGVRLRRSLVIAQFAISLMLITSVIIIYTQMQYIQNKKLGYDKEGLLFLRVHGNINVIKGYEAFKNELTASPLITGVATSNSLIVNGLDAAVSWTIDLAGKPLPVNTATLSADANYLRVYGIPLLAGKNFTPSAANTSQQQIILNERAVKEFGWIKAENAIGKPFTLDGQPGTVVGVIPDFHFQLLYQAIEPLAINYQNQHFARITLKINVQEGRQSLALIEKVWAKHFPAALFDYDFLDLFIQKQYQAEERFSKLILYFSVLSLVIACLGLYGLVAYTTAQKAKEISIRKILGASVNSIAVLLSKDFLKLIVVAGLVAMPFAWYIMQQWLQAFTYRISITWWMFGAAVTLVLVIAFITMSFQALKAALANPVEALRSE
ncbi:ABC transporter permease [Adhaeribacter pallidiroseus]|uniref:Macrolide export ATP-binding/permease protein MacB n=1 Tax=Adhaeribacter pallidiroseus TaxID=2072847 RepID=A0A369QKV0_9BACT|nr:ABC transporter permease [Adhaeribacter pallidiroseus]RDC65543.1 Macrolide export ATP-binding/permease protein MacB [Adhaeribacter pallidiroseus]